MTSRERRSMRRELERQGYSKDQIEQIINTTAETRSEATPTGIDVEGQFDLPKGKQNGKGKAKRSFQSRFKNRK